MIHRKEMSRKILQCVDRGLAVGLIAGMLLFAGLTAWWYVSFMDNAILKWLAWMMIVAVCVVSFVVDDRLWNEAVDRNADLHCRRARCCMAVVGEV